MADDLARRFLALHHGDGPLIVPNPWDPGSARILAWAGFSALATTSSGFASSMGRLDGLVSKDETLERCAAIVAAVDVPVTADLVNGFADDPAGVAQTVTDAGAAGLAGCSIEDFSGSSSQPIYDKGFATERITAAAEAARGGGQRVILTARSENYLHGHPDLADTIARLQAYQEAGADVLYAPGVTSRSDIASILAAVDRPVNVLLMADTPDVATLVELGVHRISVGGAFAYAALDALVEAALALKNEGSTAYLAAAKTGRDRARQAFGA